MFNPFLFLVVDVLALRLTSMKVFLTQVDQLSPAQRGKFIHFSDFFVFFGGKTGSETHRLLRAPVLYATSVPATLYV